MKLNHYDSRPAAHWQTVPGSRVRCVLCPRHCILEDGSMGYCGVRGAVSGELHTFNFGLSLAATEEFIETEAVVHWGPGARILSMGNIGCMMSCVFCQNWETSQIEHLNPAHIHRYQPRELVDICLQNGIKVISWTYNDPVVWHEFVVETSRLARRHGLKTLYKSALYIEKEPLEELIECIDIFSISLKSLSGSFYRERTGAELLPVLERIKQVACSGRHLEVSYLMIPGLNDSEADLRGMIEWVSSELGTEVPLHVVAFHPAYRYTEVQRTEVGALVRAREMAREKGIRYVYLGNTNLTAANDSICGGCGAMLVRRYGLISHPERIDADGRCTECGVPSPIREPLLDLQSRQHPEEESDLQRSLEFRWHSEAQSLHIVRASGDGARDRVRLRPLEGHPVTERMMPTGLDRFIVARQSEGEQGVVISWESESEFEIMPLLDRAHFPVPASREVPAQQGES